MIEWRGVTVRYGDRVALSSCTGRCVSGTVTALVGPNGGGKSTLLAALAGLAVASGEVRLAGEGARARRVALMRQSVDFPTEWRGWELASLARLAWRRPWEPERPEDRAAMVEAAREAEATALMDRPWGQLSGGERARVHFAMTLAQSTPVLLLDEPMAALDPAFADRMAARLRSLAEAGATVLVSVHDVNMAFRWADRFFALRNGTTVASGPVADLGDWLEKIYGARFAPYRGEEGEVLWFHGGARC